MKTLTLIASLNCIFLAARQNFENKRTIKLNNHPKNFSINSPDNNDMIRTVYALSAGKKLEHELKEINYLVKLKEKISRIPHHQSELDNNNAYLLNEQTKIKVIDHLRKSRVDFKEHDIPKNFENNLISNPSEVKYIHWSSVASESKVRMIYYINVIILKRKLKN